MLYTKCSCLLPLWTAKPFRRRWKSVGRMLRAGALAVALSFSAPPVQADGFTSRDFLAWDKRDRDQWLEGAVLMAGHMVHLHDQAKGKCVWDWYVKDPATARNQIFSSMRKYPDSTPTGVLISLMQHACGELAPAS